MNWPFSRPLLAVALADAVLVLVQPVVLFGAALLVEAAADVGLDGVFVLFERTFIGDLARDLVRFLLARWKLGRGHFCLRVLPFSLNPRAAHLVSRVAGIS